jgi:hypothetical protein
MALTKIRYYDGIIPESPGTLNIGDSTNFVATVTAQDFNSVSDLNLKTNIESIENALNTINQLNGYTFNWKSDGEMGVGVIAQEVEEILPDIVKTNEDNVKSVSYVSIIPVLIEAIKELSDKIDEMQ